ncbi:MAG: HAD-IA family hydrolase [Anaerolineaceae bacterium]
MDRLKGLFFDLDGVIIESEKDGHRIAFNKTFQNFGYSFQWDVNEYQELIKISGGKERMKYYFNAKGLVGNKNPEELDDLIRKMHNYKTEEFIALIEKGNLPLRPGVKRVMKKANELGLIIGICTTADKRTAHAVANNLLAEIELGFIIAGDMVANKKPDPEIYNLALETSGLTADQCVVFEDSRNGLLAAKAAGLRVIITPSVYTENEDFSEADLIVTSLGDCDGEKSMLLYSAKDIAVNGELRVEQIRNLFA